MNAIQSQLVQGTCEQLRQHPPFDAMRPADLAYLAGRLKLAYFAKGALVILANASPPPLHIIQRGQVVGGGAVTEEPVLSLSAGESFPVGALIGRRATTLNYRAATDLFCYQLDAEGFDHLMDVSVAFRNFCLRRIAHLLAESHRQTTLDYSRRAAGEMSMASPLRAAIRRAPVTAEPATPVREVLATMKQLRIGSVAIVDATLRPLGIFTQTDVIDRVALSGVDLATPIEQLMTPAPMTLDASLTLADAATTMARRRFRHVLVVEEGVLVGVISERDLFTLQRLSLQSTAKEIAAANDMAALVEAQRSARALADAMLAQGIGAEQLTQFVTTLNDALVERAFALTSRGHALTDVRFCWIGLGSEGRMEQTFATDQDNAIIFETVGDVDATRNRLLGFANDLNNNLAKLGFPLCEGDIMARNPRWCLTLTEWQHLFGQWLAQPEPEALLGATIFFDLRALMGDAALAYDLRTYLTPRAEQSSLFLKWLAQNALTARPPLNLLGDLSADDDGQIDLKKSGSRLFVDAARVFALAAGVRATNTAERLRIAGARLRMTEDEIGAAVDAFHFIQMLRLKRQHAHEASESAHENQRDAPNRVRPDTLNALEGRILKEAFRQARKLQGRLKLDYQL